MQYGSAVLPGLVLDNGGAPPSPEKLQHRLLKFLRRSVGAANYERIQFYRYVGYFPDLLQPESFNEKIARRKVFDNPRQAAVLSDKIAVREHVTRTVGEGYLSNLLLVTDDPADIDIEGLPAKFVAKANHGCSMNLIVTDKSLVDADFLKHELSRFLLTEFGPLNNEPWYSQISPRILVEEFLEDEAREIPDEYKFWVFHGRTEFVQVNTDILGAGGRAFYRPDWQLQEIFYPSYTRGSYTEPPGNLGEMIEIADKLGQGFDFVRVDLYALKSRVVFGELTFSPNAGWRKFDSRTSDNYLGSFW